MKFIYSVFFLLVMSSTAIASKTNQCLKYDPAIVELKGKMVRQHFPGRPNYQSIAGGDRKVTYWILHLDKPFCMLKGKNMFATSETNQTRVQVVFMNPVKEYALYKPLLNKKVVIIGSLYHQHTVYHKTTILISVKNIRKR